MHSLAILNIWTSLYTETWTNTDDVSCWFYVLSYLYLGISSITEFIYFKGQGFALLNTSQNFLLQGMCILNADYSKRVKMLHLLKISCFTVSHNCQYTLCSIHLQVPHLTMSPSLTRRLFLTHLLMRILSLDTVSSDKTMQTVSFLRLPFNRTVSPLNSCSSSIFACGKREMQLCILSSLRCILKMSGKKLS